MRESEDSLFYIGKGVVKRWRTERRLNGSRSSDLRVSFTFLNATYLSAHNIVVRRIFMNGISFRVLHETGIFWRDFQISVFHTIDRFRILNFVTFFFSFHFINFYKASCVRKPSIYEFAFPHKRSFLKNLKFKDASRINSQNVDTIEFQYFLDIFL